MKIFMYVILSVGVLIFIWMYMLNPNPLKKIDKYRVYYGDQFEGFSDQFSSYDAMILETNFYSLKDLELLHETSPTLYMGYLTVFEIPHWNETFIQKLNADNYLKVNNEYVFNENYENYVGDIRQETYRQLLLNEVQETIVDKGFDGVFLDTVDWIDYFVRDEEQISLELLEGYILFLKALNETYPELIIIQNRSFWSYENGSAKHIDGIMWENYTYNKATNQDLSKTFLLIQKQLMNWKKVLVLSHEGSKKEEQMAKWLHWSYYNNRLESYRQWK